MNNAPFHIGQKVVALKTDTVENTIIKGNVYTILSIHWFCKCGWVVDVGITTRLKNNYCPDCEIRKPANGVALIYHEHFAPIQTNYADATAELLEKFPQVSETPDKILKPEPINQC